MAKQPAVSDATLTKALAVYAGMVRQVLDNPQRWLGGDDEPDPDAGLPGRALDAVKDSTLGEITPASPQWPSSRSPNGSTGGSTGSASWVAWPPPRPGSPGRSPTVS